MASISIWLPVGAEHWGADDALTIGRVIARKPTTDRGLDQGKA